VRRREYGFGDGCLGGEKKRVEQIVSNAIGR
jgi:hypothetical protein